MFKPNHVSVTVVSGRNLVGRGKNGKNDAFVVMAVGETKVRTSIKEHSVVPVWEEQWEFHIPEFSSATILVTAYHKNFLGFDEFLGQICLSAIDIYDPASESQQIPRNRWYPLKGKPGKKDEHKYRGELELRIQFLCKPVGLGQPGKEFETTISNAKSKRKNSVVEENVAQKSSFAKRKMSSPAVMLTQLSASAEEEVKKRIRQVSLSNVVQSESPDQPEQHSRKQRRTSLSAGGTPRSFESSNNPNQNSPKGQTKIKPSLLKPTDLLVVKTNKYRGGGSFSGSSRAPSPMPALAEHREMSPVSKDAPWTRRSREPSIKDGDQSEEELLNSLGITKEQRKRLEMCAAPGIIGAPSESEESPPIIKVTEAHERRRRFQQKTPSGKSGDASGSGSDTEPAEAIRMRARATRSMSLAVMPRGRDSEESAVPSHRKNSHFTLLNARSADPDQADSKLSGLERLTGRPNPLSVVNLDLVYDTLTKNDLIEIIKDQKKELSRNEKRVRDLEQYIDNLLAKVLDSNPELCSKHDRIWGSIRLTL